MPETLDVVAPAKVNLTLDLLDRRSDGFHELESIIACLDLSDRLRISLDAGAKGVELECDDGSLPTGTDNLVVRAARLLARRAGQPGGVRIQLFKRLPAGAGLGGGSSDAAATLRALNQLWDLHWSIDRLLPIAAQLGSDVPALLIGGAVMARGRGEFVQPIPLAWPGCLVVAMPRIHVPTMLVFRHVEASDLVQVSRGDEGFQPGETAASLLGACRNGLEAAAFRAVPALGALHGELQEHSGQPWRLSGSGSAMFTAFDTPEQAERCVASLEERWNLPARVARIESRAPVHSEPKRRGGHHGDQRGSRPAHSNP